MSKKGMSSQEVRDLLLMSDSEEEMFDDDDNDPSYVPNAHGDSSSDNDQPSQKRRKTTTDPLVNDQFSITQPLPDLPTNEEPTPGPSDITQPLPDLPTNEEPTPGPSDITQPLPDLPTNEEPTPGPSDITQPLPDLPTNEEPTPGPSYAISALVNTPLTKKKRLRTVEERNERDAALHPLKDGCTASCKLECNKTFGCEDRKRINKEFWSLSPEERRQWIWTIVVQEPKKRTTTKEGSRRSVTNQYFLRRSFESGGGLKCVCKVFFLTTLGYSKSSDAAVMRILKSTPIEKTRPNPDQRGRHEPKNKIDRSEISEHIKKYNPAVHHYRREHAPNRLYLPSDITSSDMHADFCQSIRQIGIETYRKEIRAQNISFATSGAEECEVCKRYKEHTDEIENTQLCDCDVCANYKKHIERRDLARAAYQADVEKTNEQGEIFTSVDLQKVMMLPRLPGVKSCAFTRRIIAFNETFAGLGRSSNNIAVIWHEAVSGRNASDICSAYWAFLKKECNASHITMWGDNCTAQNKNWTFFSFLAAAVNSEDISAEKITFKYLETGHTFMSADSVHHSIERELRKCGDVRDWQEYVDTLGKAKCQTVSLEFSDFKDWPDLSNRQTINKANHKLASIVVAQFRRGHRSLFYKTSHREDSPFVCADFLKKKANIHHIPDGRQTRRGISTSKKAGILKNLCPLMPKSRNVFWERIPVNDEAADLIDEF